MRTGECLLGEFVQAYPLSGQNILRGGSWRRTNFRFWRLHLKCKAADCELKLGVHVIHCLKQWHKETIVSPRTSENEHKCLWSWKCWHGIPFCLCQLRRRSRFAANNARRRLAKLAGKTYSSNEKEKQNPLIICKTFAEIGRETEKNCLDISHASYTFFCSLSIFLSLAEFIDPYRLCVQREVEGI